MKTIIIGFDAFDPIVFEKLHSEGKMPNLGGYVDSGGYSRFSISNPAQSEVSWTSIATGLDPGGHGMFDFVHRNPANYSLDVSLLPTKQSAVGTQFLPPHHAHTIFEEAVKSGYQATSLWWPATFPAKLESPVQTIPGLGTPDIFGRLGVGSLFTLNGDFKSEDFKTRIESLNQSTKGKFSAKLIGPIRKSRNGEQETSLDISLNFTDPNTARLEFDKQAIQLNPGKWSSIFEVPFKMGFGASIRGITRAILSGTKTDPLLYFLPLQLHPLHSPWHYATAGSFIKKTWQKQGPFLTLGWPQDTTSLEENWINDEQFLNLCDMVLEERERVFMHHLNDFKEGILACVFDTLDRVQHMFWRDRQDIIENWYIRLDSLFGRISKQIDKKKDKDIQIVVVSDHGFTQFAHKVHINRWLIDNDYLFSTEGKPSSDLKKADWAQSKVYAIGLNSLYINLENRETKGIVKQYEMEALVSEVKNKLIQWVGPDKKKVVQAVWTQEEAFSGPYTSHGPDLVIGYNPGYRASAQTGLGGWEKNSIEKNNDHWGADHCVTPSAVSGVLFSNKGLKDFPHPSFRDFPTLILGKSLSPTDSKATPSYSDEDQSVIEERLKDLGYL